MRLVGRVVVGALAAAIVVRVVENFFVNDLQEFGDHHIGEGASDLVLSVFWVALCAPLAVWGLMSLRLLVRRIPRA